VGIEDHLKRFEEVRNFFFFFEASGNIVWFSLTSFVQKLVLPNFTLAHIIWRRSTFVLFLPVLFMTWKTPTDLFLTVFTSRSAQGPR
jgi:hypothetical protein